MQDQPPAASADDFLEALREVLDTSANRRLSATIAKFGDALRKVPLLFPPDPARYSAGSQTEVPVRYHALAWVLLAASIAAEVVGTIALRYADGFTRLWPPLAVGSLYTLRSG